jgi:uncharacterized protein (DUF302 family)
MQTYAIHRVLEQSFDEVLASLPAALATEGFGVLTQLEIDNIFEQKLGVSFRRYRILGACNPKLAHRALGETLLAGIMLPCNVVVWERDDAKAEVAAVDPRATPAAQSEPAIAELASEVFERLSRVIAGL